MERQVHCWLGRYFWRRESSWVSPNTSNEWVRNLPEHCICSPARNTGRFPQNPAEPSGSVTWHSSHEVGLSRVRQERETLRSTTSPFLTVLTVQTQRNAAFRALSPQVDISSLECWGLTTFALSLWIGHAWLLGLTDGGSFCFPSGKWLDDVCGKQDGNSFTKKRHTHPETQFRCP